MLCDECSHELGARDVFRCHHCGRWTPLLSPFWWAVALLIAIVGVFMVYSISTGF